MKTLFALALAVSLALNAAALWFLVVHPAAPAPVMAPATTSSAADAKPKINADTWTKLESEDLPALVARLRASGFPPEMVRAVLAAQLNAEFAARRKALTASAQSLAFWKDSEMDPKLQLALQRLGREQQKRQRELLGPDGDPEDPMTQAYRGRSLDFLSADKAAEVRRLMRDFDDRQSDLYANGYDYGTDRAKMTALEKERHAAIAAVLTPAELLDYDLRNSDTARSLRDQLSAFNPSEEEFRAIYQLRGPFDDRYRNDFIVSQEEMRARSEAEKNLTTQIKSGLTPDRAAEYDRATDYNYRRTAQLVARLELPPETTTSLYTVQKEFEQRRGDIFRAGPNATERTAQLTALQQEAITRVAPLLGNAAYVDVYKSYGGQWLQNLVPRPPPPGKK